MIAGKCFNLGSYMRTVGITKSLSKRTDGKAEEHNVHRNFEMLV